MDPSHSATAALSAPSVELEGTHAVLHRLWSSDPSGFRSFAEANGFRFVGVDHASSSASALSSGVGSKRQRQELDGADTNTTSSNASTQTGIDRAPGSLPEPPLPTSGAAAMPVVEELPSPEAALGEVPPQPVKKVSKREKKFLSGKLPPSERGFDFKRNRFRHVALHFLYLGHNYHGFAAQFQAGGAVAGKAATKAEEEHLFDTVESRLFAALTKACLIEDRETSGYTRCGRTDAGVSASGQVVALWVRSKAKLNPQQAKPLIDEPPAESWASQKKKEADAKASASRDREDDGEGEGEGGHEDGQPGSYRTPTWQRHDGLDNDDGEPYPAPTAETDYTSTLNQILPPDIRIIGWSDVESAMKGSPATAASGAGPAEGAAPSASAPMDVESSSSACSSSTSAGSAATSSSSSPSAELPFSARFSATNRCYRYFFVNRGYDFPSMRDAASRLLGQHDFRNFARYDLGNAQNFVRSVQSVRIVVLGSDEDRRRAYTPAGPLPAAAGEPEALGRLSEPWLGCFTPALPVSSALFPANAPTAASDRAKDDELSRVPVGGVCFFEVVGQAFLWNQVRCMAAVLFHVGAGYEKPSVIDYLLDIKKCDARPGYKLADEHPLCLHHCSFGEEDGGLAAMGRVPGEAPPPADDEPAVAKPDWAAPCAPELYRNMTVPSEMALRTACEPLFERWEKLLVEAAMIGSMMQRINTFALSKGLKPWTPDPKRHLSQSKVYQPFEKRPKGLTLAERWNRLGEDEKRRVASIHPHNTARMLKQIGLLEEGGEKK